MSFTLTNQAQDDIDSILDWSLQEFGSETQERYAQLILRAIRLVAVESEILGAREFAPGIWLYHLRHAKTGSQPGKVVKNPRHLLVYQQPEPGRVLILRVLHEQMDIIRHIPGEEDGDSASA